MNHTFCETVVRLEGQGGDRMIAKTGTSKRDGWAGVGAEVRIVYFVNGLTHRGVIEDTLVA